MAVRGLTEAVVGDIGGDSVQPRNKPSWVLQGRLLVMGAQQGLLGQILRLGVIAHNAADIANDRFAVGGQQP